jgi:prephenate dehydratase
VGSLSQVLSVLAFYRVNLSKIQSLPIVGQEWEYFFYLDVLFDDYQMYKKALSAIDP